MKKAILSGLSLAVVVALAIVTIHLFGSSSAQAQSSERSLVLVFTGSPVGEFRDIGGIMMDCFDLDITDPESGGIIGSGSDCLDLASAMPIGDDGGFTLNNTQFFDLPGGRIVSSITTSIQPVGAGSPGATHTTGAVPDEGTNQIDDGDGRFRDAQGRVRLNGDVDLSLFESDNIISFDCIFRIDFDD
jgi:hypothetical protein